MNFFYDPDWFNRPGPWAYTLEHFMFIIFTVIIAVILCIFIRKWSPKTVKILLISLWGFTVFMDIFKWSVIYTRVFTDSSYPFDIETMLPLHSCSMFMYICPLAFFLKDGRMKTAACSFLVCVNMIMGFITMFVGFGGKNSSVFSFFGFHTLLYHALIFITPLLMVVSGYYKLNKKDIIYGLILFGALALATWIFDEITGCDYMYIYDGHTFGVLKVIYENVHHLVWTLITVSCYVITAVAVHFLILGIYYLIDKRKHVVEEDDYGEN